MTKKHYIETVQKYGMSNEELPAKVCKRMRKAWEDFCFDDRINITIDLSREPEPVQVVRRLCKKSMVDSS